MNISCKYRYIFKGKETGKIPLKNLALELCQVKHSKENSSFMFMHIYYEGVDQYIEKARS